VCSQDEGITLVCESKNKNKKKGKKRVKKSKKKSQFAPVKD
jgi:hypothetical protein